MSSKKTKKGSKSDKAKRNVQTVEKAPGRHSKEEIISEEELDNRIAIDGDIRLYLTMYLKIFIDGHFRNPKKTKLMLHQTWAYASTSNHGGFKNYNRDQLTMYHAIVDAVKKAGKAYKIKMIIPTGTAIQNARTSFIGDHMNRDGHHLDVKVGRYTAACTWFERIFKRNVIGNPYAPESLDEARKAVAQKAAHAAVKHPYKVTDLSERR